MLKCWCPKFQESPLPFDESAGFTAPSAFGTYRVLHQIGSGVLGPVFRTYDPQRDRLVAVKAFRLDVVPEQAARLADALRRLAAATLDHQGIVPAIDAGLEGTMAFLASEYVAAETLDVALRHLAPAPLERALPILSQIAEAIDASWASGAGHGALHPRDVFVTVDAHEVRITGFGVVPALESIGIKTPIRRPYAAPERAGGDSWDIRADVYSLGAIAHELLTRRRPAAAGEQDGALTTGATAEQRVQIRRVLSVVLAEQPRHRFQSARAFTDALAGIMRGEAVSFPGDDDFESELTPQDSAGIFANDEFQLIAPALSDAERASDVRAVEPAPPIDTLPAVAPVVAAQSSEPPTASSLQDREPSPILQSEPEGERLTPGTDGLVPSAEFPVSELRSPNVQHPHPFASDAASEIPHTEPPAPQPISSPGPSSFPWAAMSAVAAAGVIVGVVMGYEFAERHRAQSAAPQPAAAAAAETEVPVSASGSAPSAAASAALTGESGPAPAVRTDARKGRVIVRSTPAGALLVIDGRPHGQTPVEVSDLRLGSHTIEVARSGYVPHTETVTLAARNAVRTVTVRLQPGLGSGGETSRPDPAPAAGAGKLFVDSRPQRARVLVDGHLIGTTPLRMSEVHAGSHAVRLELAGYRPFATTVGVKAGEQAKVTAALEEK